MSDLSDIQKILFQATQNLHALLRTTDTHERGMITMYDYRITGQIIRELRTQKGLSQDVLSGFAMIARSHLSEIETGRRNADVETLWRIANALGMKLSQLIILVEERML